MINLNHISFPDHSRVWIYQADRMLTDAEQIYILEKGKEFTNSWAAHGNELTAQLYVELDHFIVIVLDEQKESASGCSIDKSMRLILDFQKEMDNISFTNRLVSAFYHNNEVILCSYPDVKVGIENGVISCESMVFDNTIQNLEALKTSWLKPLKATWLKKLLAPENVG